MRAWTREPSGLWAPGLPMIAGGAIGTRAPYPLKLLGQAIANAAGQATVELRAPANLVGRTATITRLIASVGTTINPVLQDSFTRTVANGWGFPDKGPLWVIQTGAVARFSVGAPGPVGIARIDNAATALGIIASSVGLADIDFLSQWVTATPGTGGSFRQAGRWADASNYYAVAQPPAAGAATIVRRLAGVDTVLGTAAGAIVANNLVRLVIAGTAIKAKFWANGAAEPAAFNIEAVDTSITAAGAAAMITNAQTSASTFDVDNVILNSSSANPSWDAYLGDPGNPVNLRDSSAGTLLSRWVPALVNGQPFNPGDVLNIIAYGLPVGTQVIVTTALQVA